MELIFQDNQLVAVCKPPGLSVHDAPGPGTSVLRILREKHGFSDLRPVHRLDKGVSGVLLLAKNREAARALERRWSEVEKTYLALCEGVPVPREGLIDAPILEHQTGKPYRLANALQAFRDRHPDAECPPPPRPKTSAVHPAGRPSRTYYRVIEEGLSGAASLGQVVAAPSTANSAIDAWSLLEVRPEQGRMHQLRVHLAHLTTPLLVDPLYGRRASLKGIDGGELMNRVSLHAARLAFPHPAQDGRRVTIEACLPDDMSKLMACLHST